MGQFLDEVLALDRRLDVEGLADVRVLPDQLPVAAWNGLFRRLVGLPQVDGAPALGRLVRDPGLEAETRDVGERLDGLVGEVTPELLNGRLRVGEVPEDEPKDHA